MNELLRPIEQTAWLTGMSYFPPFVLFSSRSADKEQRLQAHLSHWEQLLDYLVNGADKLEHSLEHSFMNNFIETLVPTKEQVQ